MQDDRCFFDKQNIVKTPKVGKLSTFGNKGTQRTDQGPTRVPSMNSSQRMAIQKKFISHLRTPIVTTATTHPTS